MKEIMAFINDVKNNGFSIDNKENMGTLLALIGVIDLFIIYIGNSGIILFMDKGDPCIQFKGIICFIMYYHARYCEMEMFVCMCHTYIKKYMSSLSVN